LFVVGEFTNFSVRQGQYVSWNEGRGIFNLGLTLELFDMTSFSLVAYDLLDDFISVGISGEVYFDLF
jgi:hypothetical protein